METTEEAIFQADTLSGDIRDRILDGIVRRMPCWTKMQEYEQRRIIEESTDIARSLVRETVQAIAHHGFEHMLVTTGKWTVKDGIKLEVGASGSVEDITKLAEHGTGSAILVFAEPSAFFGQRKPAEADKDQPELPIHDDDGVIRDSVAGSASGEGDAEVASGGEGSDTINATGAGEGGGNDLPQGELPEPPEGESTETSGAGSQAGAEAGGEPPATKTGLVHNETTLREREKRQAQRARRPRAKQPEMAE